MEACNLRKTLGLSLIHDKIGGPTLIYMYNYVTLHKKHYTFLLINLLKIIIIFDRQNNLTLQLRVIKTSVFLFLSLHHTLACKWRLVSAKAGTDLKKLGTPADNYPLSYRRHRWSPIPPAAVQSGSFRPNTTSSTTFYARTPMGSCHVAGCNEATVTTAQDSPRNSLAGTLRFY